MTFLEQLKQDLHDSIMRGELQLGGESDQALNYARIHQWIDSLEEASITIGNLFAVLDHLEISRYQKLNNSGHPDYEEKDWRELTVKGVKDYYHRTGEPMRDKPA